MFMTAFGLAKQGFVLNDSKGFVFTKKMIDGSE